MSRLRALLPAALAASLLAGCGTSGSALHDWTASTPPVSPGGSAAPKTTPKAKRGAQIGVPRRLSNGITRTLLASYTGRTSLATRGDYLAVATSGFSVGDGLTLRVAPSGGTPQPARGAGRIAFFAQIHVGTDAAGEPVVTYPRCSSERIGSCDVYMWSSTTGRETPVPGVNLPTRGETEAVLDLGNALVVREHASANRLGQEDFRLGEAGADTNLVYRRVGEPAATITTKGGRDIGLYGTPAAGLDRSRITDIHDVPGKPSDPGICGLVRARVLTLGGEPVFQREVICGLGGQGLLGNTTVDGNFSFAMTAWEGGSKVFDHRLGSRTVGTGTAFSGDAYSGLQMADWAGTGGGNGFALTGDLDAGCGGRFEGDDVPGLPCQLYRVTGVRLKQLTPPALVHPD